MLGHKLKPQSLRVLCTPLEDVLGQSLHERTVEDVGVRLAAHGEPPHEVPEVQPEDHIWPGVEPSA